VKGSRPDAGLRWRGAGSIQLASADTCAPSGGPPHLRHTESCVNAHEALLTVHALHGPAGEPCGTSTVTPTLTLQADLSCGPLAEVRAFCCQACRRLAASHVCLHNRCSQLVAVDRSQDARSVALHAHTVMWRVSVSALYWVGRRSLQSSLSSTLQTRARELTSYGHIFRSGSE
jgi:hypothetical protein